MNEMHAMERVPIYCTRNARARENVEVQCIGTRSIACGAPPSCARETPSHTQELQTEYVLRLRPLANEVPASVRLRGLLKAALRWFGFRCIEV
jgi:hypothetical protein